MSFVKVQKKKGIVHFVKKGLIPSLTECLVLSFPDTIPEEIIETMTDSTQYFICQQNKIVSILSIVSHGPNRKTECFDNMIYNVATHPDYRRMGLMKRIFDRLENDFEELHLEVFEQNTKAISFYKKRKFKIIGKCSFFFTPPSLMMKKKILS